MTATDFARWIRRTDDCLPRTITLIARATPETAAEVFRAGPVRTGLPPAWDWFEHGSPTEFFGVGAGAVVIEDNGYAGTADRIIGAAAAFGRAGAVYWNVNADNRLVLAENGQVLCSVEPMWLSEMLDDCSFGRSATGADPQRLLPLITDLSFEEEYLAAALTVIERFTGVEVTDEMWAAKECGHPLRLVPHPTEAEYSAPDVHQRSAVVEDEGLVDLHAVDPAPVASEAKGRPAPVARPQATPEDAREASSGRGTVWSIAREPGFFDDGTRGPRFGRFHVDGLDQVVSMTVDEETVFAVGIDGSLMAWGSNNRGRSGVGHSDPVSHPTPVDLPSGVRSVCTGGTVTYALLWDSTVWGWGRPWSGTLADGKTRSSAVPVAVPALRDVAVLTGNGDTFAALTSSGAVWVWGSGADGEFGDGVGHRKPANEPREVSGLPPVVAIEMTGRAVTARAKNGSVLVWGGSFWLGDGDGGSRSVIRRPTVVEGLGDVVTLGSGWALDTDGRLRIWRRVRTPPLPWERTAATTTYDVGPGPESDLEDRALAVEARGFAHISDGTAGEAELEDHGRWDDLSPRADGDDGSSDSSTGELRAVVVAGLDGLRAVDGIHALRMDGTVWTWVGGVRGGQDWSPRPAPIAGMSSVIALAGGGLPCAIGAGGVVWTWDDEIDALGRATGGRVVSQVPGLTGVTAIAGDDHQILVVVDET